MGLGQAIFGKEKNTERSHDTIPLMLDFAERAPTQKEDPMIRI